MAPLNDLPSFSDSLTVSLSWTLHKDEAAGENISRGSFLQLHLNPVCPPCVSKDLSFHEDDSSLFFSPLWNKSEHLHLLVAVIFVSVGSQSPVVNVEFNLLLKSDIPAVTHTVCFGGSGEAVDVGGVLFWPMIGWNKAQISWICGVTVQSSSRLGAEELLTLRHITHSHFNAPLAPRLRFYLKPVSSHCI